MDLKKEVLERIHERLLKEFLDMLVLNRLRHNPMSGYDAIQYIHKRFDILISSGTVYSTFYSLEREGLIEGRSEASKRVYSLTGQGEETIESISDSRQMILRFLEKILIPDNPA